MDFNKTVKDSDNGISEKDTKVDTENITPEEKEQQDKFLKAMTNGDSADNHGDSDDSDDSDEEDDEEEEESDSDDDDSDKDESEEEEEDESDDSEDSDKEDEDEDEEGSEDKKDKKSDDKSDEDDEEDDESNKGLDHKGKEAQENAEDDQHADDDKGDDSPEVAREKEFKNVLSFFKEHSELIPESTIENYKKFYESGEKAFLHIDNDLHKISRELENISDKLPVKERLERAFLVVFKDKILKAERKKAATIAEVKNQKVNKSASGPTSTNSQKSSKYDSEQLEVMKRMEVGPYKPKKK